MARNNREEVNQQAAGGDRTVYILTSTVTKKARVESTSAEWLVQGTTWRGCLVALVSAMPGAMVWTVHVALPAQSRWT